MPLDDAELSRRLDEMPVMEPPADLRTSIMDGVRGSQLTVRSFPLLPRKWNTVVWPFTFA